MIALAAGAALIAAAPAPIARPLPPSTVVAPTPLLKAGYMRIGRRGIAFLPDRKAGEALPLLVLFHGAGSTAQDMMRVLIPEAAARGLALLAVQSEAQTWDLITRHFATGEATLLRSNEVLPGGDRRSADAAIALLKTQATIDPARVGALGFSDGASYALSIGAAEPSRFSFVAGFSPAFALIPDGKDDSGQRIFIAHGRQDTVLPFRQSRDAICPDFYHSGRVVRFRAFDGDHVISRAVLHEALDDFLIPSSRPPAGDRAYHCDR